MSDLGKALIRLREALDSVEPRLDQDTSGSTLEDFKATVDSARTTVRAILSATAATDYNAFVREFRLRRAAQVCQGVLYGLADGTTTAATPGFDKLRSTVAETLERFDQY